MLEENQETKETKETKQEGFKGEINLDQDFFKMLEVVNSLVEEVKFYADENKIKIVSMDAANVAMVKLEYPPIKSNVEESGYFTVNLSWLMKTAKRCKNDEVTMKVDQYNLIVKTSKKTFTLPLIEIEEQNREAPELNFSAVVKMDPKDFKETIQDIKLASDSTEFSLSNGKFSMNGGSATKNLKAYIEDNNSVVETDPGEEIKTKYSLEYLEKISQGSKLSDELKIQFGKEYPAKFSFGDNLEIILAPRVENE